MASVESTPLKNLMVPISTDWVMDLRWAWIYITPLMTLDYGSKRFTWVMLWQSSFTSPILPIQSQPNTYRVCTLNPNNSSLIFLPQNRTITFTTTSAALELPDPRYLKLHAAVCRVAHMCGAAEYLDMHDRDVETTKVLAHNGSSGDILASRLHRLALVA